MSAQKANKIPLTLSKKNIIGVKIEYDIGHTLLKGIFSMYPYNSSNSLYDLSAYNALRERNGMSSSHEGSFDYNDSYQAPNPPSSSYPSYNDLPPSPVRYASDSPPRTSSYYPSHSSYGDSSDSYRHTEDTSNYYPQSEEYNSANWGNFHEDVDYSPLRNFSSLAIDASAPPPPPAFVPYEPPPVFIAPMPVFVPQQPVYYPQHQVPVYQPPYTSVLSNYSPPRPTAPAGASFTLDRGIGFKEGGCVISCIATVTGIDYATVRKKAFAMAEKGKIDYDGNGLSYFDAKKVLKKLGYGSLVEEARSWSAVPDLAFVTIKGAEGKHHAVLFERNSHGEFIYDWQNETPVRKDPDLKISDPFYLEIYK